MSDNNMKGICIEVSPLVNSWSYSLVYSNVWEYKPKYNDCWSIWKRW